LPTLVGKTQQRLDTHPLMKNIFKIPPKSRHFPSAFVKLLLSSLTSNTTSKFFRSVYNCENEDPIDQDTRGGGTGGGRRRNKEQEVLGFCV
jgi:hypothetical protein